MVRVLFTIKQDRNISTTTTEAINVVLTASGGASN